MKKRPLSITIIGWLFIVVGTVGLIYHARELRLSLDYDLVLACLIRLVAIVGGLFLLRGHNWARWVLILWLLYHVVLSVFHSLSQLAFHAVFLVVIGYFLFRPNTSKYFRSGSFSNEAP